MAKQPCKYCLLMIDTRGMQAHVSFKHSSYVSREFALRPVVWVMLWVLEGFMPPDLSKNVLPAPEPGVTIDYGSTLTGMLPPCQKMPRWF